MRFDTNIDAEIIGHQLNRIRGDASRPPAASIIVPVNAQGDLENVLHVLSDVSRYDGPHTVEVILVVNNYPDDAPPAQIEEYRRLGIRVVALSNVRRPGEAVGFSARIPGVRAAESDVCILFDADVRVPNPTPLVNWYVDRFSEGAGAAYTHVAYYDYTKALSLRVRFAAHHASRWIKRSLLGIPTTRGSNYAVQRNVMLDLYEQRMLADEMNVGPTFKKHGLPVAYSSRRELYVYTSGRMFSPGWLRMIPYYWYRLRYNLRTLPVRVDVAGHTGRESDPIRKYVNNQPVK